MYDVTKLSPYKQAIAVLVLALAGMVGAKLLQLINLMETNPEKTWILAITFALFFSVFNCIYSLGTKINSEKYWTQSLLAFIFTIGCLALFAYIISGKGINETGSFRWLFIVVTFCYLALTSIARLMKWVVEYAEKEEWQHPKKRK